MTIDLKFESKGEHLQVNISGQWIVDATVETLKTIHRVADSKQQTRILLDCMQVSPPDTEMVRFHTGELIAKIFRPPYKTVIIYPAELIN